MKQSILFNFSLKQKYIVNFLIVIIITSNFCNIGHYSIYHFISGVKGIEKYNLSLLLKAEKLRHMALTHRRHQKDLIRNIGNLKNNISILIN